MLKEPGIRLGLLLMLSLAGLWGPTATAAAQELVTVQAGTMPILLTAPHGGNNPVPGVPRRTDGTLVQDARTDELAAAVSSRLETLSCARPYMVIARFHRRYIDANRAPEEAYENPAAIPYYASYHGAIRQFVDEIRERYPEGALLVDLHGQGQEPTRIHRGTRNGLTVRRLLDRAGPPPLVGPQSILGRLQAAGYDVFPPNTPPPEPREDPRFNGGYTVGNYGSQQPDGIDALQLEIGARFRQEDTLQPLADQLAAAIADYLGAFSGDRPRCG